MKILVLGGGLQGSACAFDLLTHTDATVTLADARPGKLPPMLSAAAGDRLTVLGLDARNEGAARELIAAHDAALCALPYYFNFPMTKLAVEVGTHFADLGGNTEIVRQQETLDEAARRQGVAITPDVGLAPGLVNVLAVEGMRRLDRTQRVRLFVGGLPQHPEPPLNYQVVYSLEGALDYYTTASWIVRDGKPARVDALSEVETVTFPEPVGDLEAFHTGGGISTMPWAYAGRVESMEYKTLRYPGHAAIMRAIRELGLLSLDSIDVHGAAVRPRDVFIAATDRRLRRPGSEDFVALQVVVEGEDAGGANTSVRFQLLDYYDATNRISAMMRTTGYSLSITGQMQVDGRLGTHGVKPAYQTTPFDEYVKELKKRGVVIQEA